jgi:hypothetical protein
MEFKSHRNFFRKQCNDDPPALRGQVVMLLKCRLKKADIFLKGSSQENTCKRFVRIKTLFLLRTGLVQQELGGLKILALTLINSETK